MTSDHIKRLADKYTLKTADKIPPPLPKREEPKAANSNVAPKEDHEEKRKVWPRWKTQLFNEIRPHSICIVGTDKTVQVSVDNADGTWTTFGGNRGCRPMRAVPSLSGSLRDTVTPRFNNDPFIFIGVLTRVWTDTEIHAKALAVFIPDEMQKVADVREPAKLDHGFIDVGPDFDLAMFELRLFAIAEEARIRLWDDEGLSQYLDQLGEQRMKMSGRGL